ncbi:MAG: hypothetical protein QXT27_03960 [Pyrobaculum sp.]
MLTELYRTGKIKQEALGVLAKTIICIKTGCLASGPEVEFLGSTIQLAESITLSPKVQKTSAQQKQAQQPQAPREKKHPQEVKPKPTQPQVRHETIQTPSKQPDIQQRSWESLVSLLSREAKIDRAKAEDILNAVANYLSIYPSVGVLRLVEDISRISKTENRVVKTALEILRSLDYVDIKEEGVVNLKKALRSGEIPL